jgi:hypothetical protein
MKLAFLQQAAMAKLLAHSISKNDRDSNPPNGSACQKMAG